MRVNSAGSGSRSLKLDPEMFVSIRADASELRGASDPARNWWQHVSIRADASELLEVLSCGCIEESAAWFQFALMRVNSLRSSSRLVSQAPWNVSIRADASELLEVQRKK